MVAIVFQERNTPFCPSLMQTKVTHCYVVVQPMEVEGPTQYKVKIVKFWAKRAPDRNFSEQAPDSQ